MQVSFRLKRRHAVWWRILIHLMNLSHFVPTMHYSGAHGLRTFIYYRLIYLEDFYGYSHFLFQTHSHSLRVFWLVTINWRLGTVEISSSVHPLCGNECKLVFHRPIFIFVSHYLFYPLQIEHNAERLIWHPSIKCLRGSTRWNGCSNKPGTASHNVSYSNLFTRQNSVINFTTILDSGDWTRCALLCKFYFKI